MGFEAGYAIVADIEGGYSDHPDDYGGRTMYGVTETVARAWGYSGLMRDLPAGTAKEIFKEEYWDLINLGSLNDPLLANMILDASVNHGQKWAVKLAQRAYNALHKNTIAEDGIMGSNTLKALNNEEDKFKLKLWYLIVRGRYFYEIVNNNPSQKAFIGGWTNRLNVWFTLLYEDTESRIAYEPKKELTLEDFLTFIRTKINRRFN